MRLLRSLASSALCLAALMPPMPGLFTRCHGQQETAHKVAGPFGHRLAATCSADPGSIRIGETALIRVQVINPENRPLHYGFRSTEGSVLGSAQQATLTTAGIDPRTSQAVVTCDVSDGAGHNVSATTVVTLLPPARRAMHKGVLPQAPQGGESKHAPLGPIPVQQPAHPGGSSPSQGTVAAHGNGQPAAAANPYALGDQVEAWKQTLRNGAIDYAVPSPMQVNTASTVRVTIHGYADTQAASHGATGTGVLKVSQNMKVELLAADNPGEFVIAAQGSEPIQFVPNDGAATWLWSVTPTDAARKQKLQVRVFLEFEGNIEQDVLDRNYSVDVDVQPVEQIIKHDYTSDPTAWFKYLLPGGAGFAALAAVWGWLRSRRKAKGDDAADEKS